MNAAITIGIIVFVVVLVAIAVYVVQTLKAAQRALNNVADTLEGVERQVEGITTETTLLLQKTNDLAEDDNNKVVRLNSVFEGIDEVGDTFNNLTSSMKKLSKSISVSTEDDVEKSTDSVKWNIVIMNIWSNR